jgi:hypothetical protein
MDYVFFGPAERELGSPSLLDGLDPVFQQGRVTIYRIPH